MRRRVRDDDFIIELTEAEAAAGTYDAAARSAFRHEDAAEEESSQFVASDVDDGVVKIQLVLGLPLSEIAHVIREHGVVVRHLCVCVRARVCVRFELRTRTISLPRATRKRQVSRI